MLAELDRCGRAVNALNEIRRLHTPLNSDGVTVCVLCCLDTGRHRSEECEDSHEHIVDGPVCSTTEIIARAGL